MFGVTTGCWLIPTLPFVGVFRSCRYLTAQPILCLSNECLMKFLQIILLLLCSEASAIEATLNMPWVEIHGQRFYVELAADNTSRSRGLMLREELAKDRGMFFVFPNERVQLFWMKNTRIPLDIIYLDNQFRVVSMALDAQPCKSDPCLVYSSHVPVRYVLEINAGIASSLTLQLGDVIHLERSMPVPQ